MQDLTWNEKMKLEALERLTLLNTSPLSRAKILNDWQLTKCVVDFENETVNDEEPITEEEFSLIKKFEERYEGKVYYLIQDEGMWPDGCMFPRYTFLYVSKYESDWEMDKVECIQRCKTIPAYVMNLEEPECSEMTEISYKLVEGTIINMS